jgi:hypothetical protein
MMALENTLSAHEQLEDGMKCFRMVCGLDYLSRVNDIYCLLSHRIVMEFTPGAIIRVRA